MKVGINAGGITIISDITVTTAKFVTLALNSLTCGFDVAKPTLTSTLTPAPATDIVTDRNTILAEAGLLTAINTALNSLDAKKFCNNIKTKVSTKIAAYLPPFDSATTLGKLSWAYKNAKGTTKTLSKTPNLNTIGTTYVSTATAYSKTVFAIYDNGRPPVSELESNSSGPSSEMKILGDEKSLVSDGAAPTAINGDYCIAVKDELITTYMGVAAKFYLADSGFGLSEEDIGESYSPFNFYQFWELSLYYNEFYKMMEKKTYDPLDKFGVACVYGSASNFKMGTDAKTATATADFTCNLYVGANKPANYLTGYTGLKISTAITMTFSWKPKFINAEVTKSKFSVPKVADVTGWTFNTDTIKDTFFSRVTKPLVDKALSASAKYGLFGSTTVETTANGLVFSYLDKATVTPTTSANPNPYYDATAKETTICFTKATK